MTENEMDELYESAEDWGENKLREILRVDHFNKMGMGADYGYQSLVFLGESSHTLSLATTVLGNADNVPEEVKRKLKAIQNQVHEVKELIREAGKAK